MIGFLLYVARCCASRIMQCFLSQVWLCHCITVLGAKAVFIGAVAFSCLLIIFLELGQASIKHASPRNGPVLFVDLAEILGSTNSRLIPSVNE